MENPCIQFMIGMTASSTQNSQPIKKIESKKEVENDNKIFKKTMEHATQKVKKDKPEKQNGVDTKENVIEENSPFKQTIQTVKTQKVNKSILDSNMNLEEVVMDVEQMQALIMQLLMDGLGMNEEQIKQTLQNQGLTLMDLTDEVHFRDFMMEQFKMDEWELLGNEDLVKKMRNILESIQNIKTVVYTQQQVIKIEAEVSQDSILQEKIMAEPKQLNQNQPIEEQVQTEVSSLITDTYKKEVKSQQVSTLAAQGVDNPQGTTGLGLTVPIQMIVETGELKNWQGTSQLLQGQGMKSNIPEIHQQIIEKIQYNELQQSKEMELQLVPKELGKLTLKLVEHQGVVSAQIKVENDKTKEMILQNLETLKEGLEKQGLTIADVEVEVKKDPRQYQMEKEKQKSSKRIQEIIHQHFMEDDQVTIAPKDTLTSAELDYRA